MGCPTHPAAAVVVSGCEGDPDVAADPLAGRSEVVGCGRRDAINGPHSQRRHGDSHGFLVPAVSLVLAILLERQRLGGPGQRPVTHREFWIGVLWIALSIVAHLFALFYRRFLLSALALVSTLGGAVFTLGGTATLRRHAFPLAFLLLMIPLPWLEESTPLLSRWVAVAVAAISRAMGMKVAISGARIELAGTALIIGAPCSGVNSLAALTTLATLYAYLTRCELAPRLLIVAVAIPIALLANLLRVLLILILAQYWSVEIALGFFHDWSSPALFLIALFTLLAVGRGLGCQGHRFDTLP